MKHFLTLNKKKITSSILSLIMLGGAMAIGACKTNGGSQSTNGESFPSQSDSVVDRPSDSSPEINEKVDISTIEFGDLRIQLLSNTIVRVENKGAKGFEDRPSYIVQNRDRYEEVSFTLEETAEEGHVIKTANYYVHIPSGATAEDVYITTAFGDKLWAYSDAGRTDTNVYLPSPSDELKSWYFTDSPRIIPSKYGYSDVNGINNLQDWDFDNDALDTFVFLPQGNYEQFCSDYVRVTGSSEMVKLQTLGFWDSRWYAYTSETAIEQIEDYRNKGYSIDVLVIDTDWRMNASTGYQINEALFPDMAAFLKKCEDMGIDICFNDHPEPVRGTTNGLDKAEVDYRNKELTLVLSMGLDYWWYDRNWHVCLNSADPDISVFAFGMYAYQWITKDYRESITDLNEFAERSLIMGNVDGCLHGKWNYASDISSHRYSIQWTGDIGADSTALSQEIYASVFGGAEVGLPYMSSDIGGHTQPVTDDMYSRWIQYGALSTICRVHCTNYSYIGQIGRMPWLFGETAEEVAHTYIDMRYRLLPLFYSLARENYDNGLPIMRRTDILYPEYVEASNNDQYMLGDYILVAPISEAKVRKIVPSKNLTNSSGGNGLKAEYYNNATWSGTPTQTKVDSNIDFDWGTKGPLGMGTDNFSIKWTGDITIGDKDAKLTFFSDDAVIVYIDGQKVIDGSDVYDTFLSTDVLKANSKHSIEVHYAEFGGNAHVFMYYEEEQAVSYNSRSVFIPEGTWIDVWSGQTYVGPKTYTVTHPLETSPIFVREGSMVALAPNMSNVREKDWSEMVLDIYPSKNYDASISVYEDDIETTAYKKGQYRTTEVEMDYNDEKGALVVKINPTVGDFEGDRAFEERTWNIRLHETANMKDLSYVKVNGKVVPVETILKSKDGKPFAYEGASLDANVYTFTVSGSIREEYVIELYYDNALDTKANEDYQVQEVPFEIDIEEAGDAVNLNDEAIDWVSFGEGEGFVSKENLGIFTQPESYDKQWVSQGNFFTKVFEDESTNSNATTSQKDFSFVINTTSDAKYYVLYLGGNQSTAKITVRDSAGNVKTETFGNIDGEYLRRVVIHTTSDVEGQLYVTYSAVASETSGTGTPSYVTFACAIADNELPEKVMFEESSAKVEIDSIEDAYGSVNLSEAGANLGEDTLDWMHFGNDGGFNHVEKLNADYIQNASFTNAQGFSDYTMILSYNDGTEIGAHTGTQKGTCTPGVISLVVDINPNVKHIILYTGTYQATNTIEIYSRKGTLLAVSTPFNAVNVANTKIVVISVEALQEERIIINIKSSNELNGGNVSLAGMAVTGVSSNETVTGELISCEEISKNIDLDALNYQDWYHVGENAAKDGADLISAVQISNGYNYRYEDYTSTISFNGNSPVSSGRAFDYAIFDVTVDENTQELVLYASVYQATAGITILDEEGNVVFKAEPYSTMASGAMGIEVHIKIEATQSSTLTVVYYKGGSGGGNAGLAAIAVK